MYASREAVSSSKDLNRTGLENFTREMKREIDFLIKSTVKEIHEDRIHHYIKLQKTEMVVRD